MNNTAYIVWDILSVFKTYNELVLIANNRKSVFQFAIETTANEYLKYLYRTNFK